MQATMKARLETLQFDASADQKQQEVDPEEPLMPTWPTVASATGGSNMPPYFAESQQATKQNTGDYKEHLFGVMYVGLSTVGFSLASVLVKLDLQPSGEKFPTVEITVLRAIVGFLFGVAGIIVRGLPIIPRACEGAFKIALLRGALDFVAGNLFYFACSRVPIAIATVIYFTNPFWAGLLAKVFLGEDYDCKRMAILVTGSLGILVTLWPDLTHGETLSASGLVAAGLGSIFQASQLVAGRACSGNDLHWLHHIVTFSFAGLVLGGPALAACTVAGYRSEIFVPVQYWTLSEGVVTMGIVAFALISQLLLIQGLRHIPATTTSVVRILDIPLAFVWEFLLLRVCPSSCQIFGGSILVLACTLLSRVK